MDVWTFGDPPRRFQLLGIIQDERPGGGIPMAQLRHNIVQKARATGGDAVILVSSTSQVVGYDTDVSVQRYGQNAFASATTDAITRRNSTYIVIKYLD